jgi:hypothetical protein
MKTFVAFFSYLALTSMSFASIHPDTAIARVEMMQNRPNGLEYRCSQDDKDEIESMGSSLCVKRMRSFAEDERFDCSLTAVKLDSCTAECLDSSEQLTAKLKINLLSSCKPEPKVSIRKVTIVRYR